MQTPIPTILEKSKNGTYFVQQSDQITM